METYNQCRFIISSRPGGYVTNPLTGVSTLEVQPFTRKQQTDFVHNWYLANEIMSQQKDDAGVHQDAQREAEDLLSRIHESRALPALAVNPLLLTLIASVHRFRSSLPRRRVELYAEICSVFLGTRRASYGIEDDLTPAQKQRVLQPLAYTMMEREIREIAVDEAAAIIWGPLQLVSPQSKPGTFLEVIENSSGLLIEKENSFYSFAHLTFQEFLAAQHIQEIGAEQTLINNIDSSWWRETTRLYCAQNDASDIIQACLSGKLFIGRITLAAECVEEARDVRPQLREQLRQILDEWLDLPGDESETFRQLAAETLLALRLSRMNRINEDLYVDSELITQAEYQLFLDEKREQGDYHQPDHWENQHFTLGRGKEPVAGVRPRDSVAFCAWLTGRETVDNWEYRLPRPGETATHVFPSVGYWSFDSSTDSYSFTSPAQSQPSLSVDTLKTYRALDLACAFDRPFDRALDRAFELEHDRAPDLSFDHIRALALADTVGHAVADLYEDVYDRAIDESVGLFRDDASTRDRETYYALSRTRTLAHDLVLDRDRAAALLVAGYLQFVIEQNQPRFQVRRNTSLTGLESLRDAYLDLFVDLVILEERRKGNLQAFEGILIVKERRKDDPL